ncbi:MAG: ABC transporter permease [Candidatus Raymondbacteria bacterium RifOxyA12_full_50_37]|nr:MAG: ABC transporter permease [Candidatus Raymondbacteria bacterium RifOxyA12_full_50_37]OGJ92776.1 MAG: ABC transporter permease [Candidatus Raymondbacteria bacterium RIFOXYA2_FULL_49_16]OGK00283.1 MAG: ABC transporter permease [Candidatus Raymondbacteria bacterium RifOxyB12_full_50_8]OGP44552.1 MAG: ABC transporter permease [Candidatus Raymondbacteria bacterium RIFOXYB2_FULL_49_35]
MTMEAIRKDDTRWFKIRNSAWFNPKLVAGAGIMLLLVLTGLIGPLFWDTHQSRVASVPLNLPPAWVADPGPDFPKADPHHPLGTESSGRDMLALLIAAMPNTLKIGLIAASIGMFIGILLGFTAGFLGGWVDNIIQTISDSVITIPSLAVLIVISSYVRQIDITNMGLLLALFAWPGPTRVIRSQVLSMRERGYVRMARLSCVSTPAIMFKELLPNLLPYLAASFTGSVSGNILAATGLEALGLGPSRIPTLGMTIFYAIRASAIIRGMWWWWGFPILMLILIFVALFLMTIGMDEVANPRLRKAKA